MYGDPTTIRDLCANVKTTITDGQITAAAKWADARINNAISSRYPYWPNDSLGAAISPIPDSIVVISELLTAYRLELRFFAQNEAGTNIANPYANGLKRDAFDMLKSIIKGEDNIDDLEEASPLRNSTPDTKIRSVSGLGASGGLR